MTTCTEESITEPIMILLQCTYLNEDEFVRYILPLLGLSSLQLIQNIFPVALSLRFYLIYETLWKK